ALLEMKTQETATKMVDYYAQHPVTIRGRTVIIQYSNHAELKTEQPNAAAENALSSANGLVSTYQQDEPPSVLRVIVENLMAPVTIEVLHKIFSRFGMVQKIVIFSKNNTFQALIQMGSSTEALAAKLVLNDQNIYNGCCTLRIDFSKLNTLNVKFNNEKSRDFTVNRAPGDNPLAYFDPNLAPHLAAAQLPAMSMHSLTSPVAPFGQAIMAPQASVNSILLVSNLDDEITPDALFTLFASQISTGVYGDVQRVKIMYNKKDNALIQFTDASQAQQALQNLNGVRLFGRPLKIAFSRHARSRCQRRGADAGLTKIFTNSPLHRFKKPHSKNFQNIFPPSQILHLSNIPLEVPEEKIKAIFEDFGFNVVAIKFFQKEKKMALVQMPTVEDSVIALIVSAHYFPSATLVLVHSSYMFSSHSIPITRHNTLQQFQKLHNYQLSANYHLRVSFSKSVI
uniref:Polypyrimidine tract binding protein 3 n=1 Tax=Macrostomum lignano TaxID=282301 RepID=A0A1I8FSU4_9PLAT